ncbi:MAG: GTP-binding protein, partial [Oscillospiraceae bacterium]|nr:GTP-binding protein [Oscillospiraceae bacterium]
MDNIVIGLAAHVDAGKTTLAEELLFAGGAIRKKGRVDEGSAYLDDSDIERSRGITVFSHQAVMRTEHKYITLLDTPGHADFAARAEQCIRVMDMCILLISASDGIQSHTKTLWRLLEQSHVPVLFFVNKTDLVGIDRERVYAQLRQLTDDRAADFSGDVRESAALADDRLFEAWSEGGLTDDMIRDAIADRRVYPVMWGSALKSRGIEELIHIIDRFAPVKSYTDVFGARAFKLTSDGKNVLVHIKVTGGKLAVKDVVDGHKINEIRIFSGGRAEQADCVYAGQCAAFVCDGIRPGDGLGAEEDDRSYGMVPVMRYSVSADC